MPSKPAAQGKQGRRSRGPRDERGVTMAQITDAARASFANHGWAGTTLRGVARQAGVDPALVHYYFSSKEELLDASTNPPERWVASIHETNLVPVDARGEAIVRNLVWSWSQPDISEALGSILMTAAHEPRTREKLRATLTLGLLPAVADTLDADERMLRASLVASQVLGVIMLRYVWQIEPLASVPEDELVALVGPNLQRYLTGPLR